MLVRNKITALTFIVIVGFSVFSCDNALGGGANSINNDSWANCPESRRCLSGDIVSEEARYCCNSNEVCASRINPEEGGWCLTPDEQILYAPVLIYKSRGGIQCESQGLTAQESEQTLEEQSLQVFTSQCANWTGVAVTTVCGGNTLGIVIHTIYARDLAQAESLGYGSLESALAQDTYDGYQLYGCE